MSHILPSPHSLHDVARVNALDGSSESGGSTLEPPNTAARLFQAAFFDLQLTFANKVCLISGHPIGSVLLDYTNLYVRFGLGREFDPANERWLAYLSGLQCADDQRDWTYQFYCADAEAHTTPSVVATVGCFSFGFLPDRSIRIHFRNPPRRDYSPIGRTRDAERREELRALAAHMRTRAELETVVCGASWLYNLDAYRRLFPPVYIESGRMGHSRFRSMTLWGQFLNYRGELNRSVADHFISALDRASTMDDIEACFPFPVLTLHASVADFCAFYGA